MDRSESIAELAKALAAAQGQIKNPGKNREVSVRMKEGGAYKFKYATFDGILDAIRKPLSDNGLWFIQTIGDGAMVTRITHGSGEWIDSILPMPGLNGKPQEIGSLITYFKRYGLCAAFGIAADEDDDANSAQGNEVEFTPRHDRRRPAAQPNEQASETRAKPAPLLGKHKTRASLRQAAGNIANALSEAADGGDESHVDQVLSEWAEDIEQIKAEGAPDWWFNKDWGLEAQIARAREAVAEKAA